MWSSLVLGMAAVIAISLLGLEMVGRLQMLQDITEHRIRELAARVSPSVAETPIPTALQDWDTAFQEATGIFMPHAAPPTEDQ